MNGLVRLAAQIEPRSIASPLEPDPGLFEGEQLSPSFADAFVDASINAATNISGNARTNAFAAVDSGDSEIEGEGSREETGKDNIADDMLPLETAKGEREGPEPLKPDLDIPLIPAGKSGEQEVLIEPSSEAEAESAPEYAIAKSGKTADENLPINKKMQRDAVAQNKPIARSAHISPSPPESPKDARIISDLPLAPPTHYVPIKGKAAPLTENIIVKDAPSLDEAPAKITRLERKTLAGSVPDEAMSPPRPVIRSGPAPAMPTVAAPAVTITETAITHNTPAPTTAPMPAAPTTAAPVITALTMDAGNQWIVRLSQDIGQLSADKPALNFQLQPEHLGKLSVRISASAAGDIVRMETENENVKALLVGSQGRLEQDIRLSGLKLARVDVTVQDNSGSQLGQQGAGSRDGGAEPGRSGGAQRDSQSPGEQSPRNKSQAVTEQNMFPQNGIAGASPHHGARYA